MPISEYLKKQVIETLKEGGGFSVPREIKGAKGFYVAASGHRPEEYNINELGKVNYGNDEYSVYVRLG